MIQKRYEMNFSESLLRNHTKEANLAIAFICRLIMLLMLVIVGCAKLGYFAIADNIYPAAVIALAILSLPTILYNILRLNSGLIRYFVLALIVLLVGMLYVMLGHNVVMLLAFPLVLSCLYCSRGCMLFTFILSLPVMIAAHILSYNLKMVPDDPFQTMDQVIYYGIIPRTVQYVAFAVLCYGITDRIKKLLRRLENANNELYQDQENLVAALSGLIEVQSKETGMHVKRVSEYTKVLCRGLGMDEEETWKVGLGAMMHDVGKVAVPKEILEKPGKLTEEEFTKIKMHVFYGKEMLSKYPGEIMQTAAIIANEHHEHYDGTGYLGMIGNDISLPARCVSLADFFDALVSKRVYKSAWKPEEVRREILNQRGKFFDPHVVDIFDAHYDEFIKILKRYPDDNVMKSSIEEIFDVKKREVF